MHAPADDSELLTAGEAAAAATRWRRIVSAGAAEVTVRTVRSWVARRHLAPTGRRVRGPRGRWQQLFDPDDVATAERATRDRALRLVGIGATPGRCP